jgi:hypothetical protein
MYSQISHVYCFELQVTQFYSYTIKNLFYFSLVFHFKKMPDNRHSVLVLTFYYRLFLCYFQMPCEDMHINSREIT